MDLLEIEKEKIISQWDKYIVKANGLYHLGERHIVYMPSGTLVISGLVKYTKYKGWDYLWKFILYEENDKVCLENKLFYRRKLVFHNCKPTKHIIYNPDVFLPGARVV